MGYSGRKLEIHNGQENANIETQFSEVSKGNKDSKKNWKGPFVVHPDNCYDFILFVF